ncbi:hypothetical protein [Rhodophyticola porphyridii]|nr:hypothetical protein [Rhodophyticola porphyridii]
MGEIDQRVAHKRRIVDMRCRQVPVDPFVCLGQMARDRRRISQRMQR